MPDPLTPAALAELERLCAERAEALRERDSEEPARATDEVLRLVNEDLARTVPSLLAEVQRLRAKPDASFRTVCPCAFPEIEPCSLSCTCRTPVRSGGCRRCARYGSYEQRLSKARWLVEQSTELAALRECLRWRSAADELPEAGVRVLVRDAAGNSYLAIAGSGEEEALWLTDAEAWDSQPTDRWLSVPEESE